MIIKNEDEERIVKKNWKSIWNKIEVFHIHTTNLHYNKYVEKASDYTLAFLYFMLTCSFWK
ncbi:hypothetical protein D3C78_816410 [compost metagenome]